MPNITPEQAADLSWLVGMAYKAPPGWWKKGDGKRMDRIQALFAQLSEEYQRVPSPFERRKSVTPTEPAQDEDE